MTVERFVQNISLNNLIDMYDEITSRTFPRDSKVRELCRHINNRIDAGTMKAPATYRKMYLPSLVKVLHQEMARRYVKLVAAKAKPVMDGQLSFVREANQG